MRRRMGKKSNKAVRGCPSILRTLEEELRRQKRIPEADELRDFIGPLDPDPLAAARKRWGALLRRLGDKP
ncbi:hypothetical protein A3H16_03265 [Candidatus Kaiserbacteria bacterium RIFCSPLOWO2_12_FULL_53_8]|uniref:Uncharacterized protein n=1 Tax=Candidatus Kaiserbacteria bacterium RIFCSPLOWO2_12_FULL_53_8 TaxID=1798529 RepID=A0A1F6G0U5_9BACT|nr:MAG: hypothetical protein A3H16_03265 [Candidatus Kaiserbacteria bacterium RIFCSPLOWO2_12_FULL_53_8]